MLAPQIILAARIHVHHFYASALVYLVLRLSMHFQGLIPRLVSVPPATVHGRYGMKSLPLSKLLLQ